MTEYSMDHLVGAGETLKPLQENQLKVLREIDSGYDTQQSIADELGMGRSTISKYMNQFRNIPVPLIESSGHDTWTTETAEYILNTLEDEGIDLLPHAKKKRADIAAVTLHEAQTGDRIPELQNRVESYDFEDPSSNYEAFVSDYFDDEIGIFELRDDETIEVNHKGEVQKDILHTTADQLVEEPERNYRLAVYLAKETEDGLEPVQPVDKDFTEDEIQELLNEDLE